MSHTQNLASKGEYVRLSELKSTRNLLFIIASLLAVLTVLLVYFTTHFQPKFPTIGLTAFLIVCILYTCQFVSKRLATASKKQDLIFVSHGNRPSRQVKTSWLKSVKIISIFGVCLCKITYRYDGVKYSSILVGKKEIFANHLYLAA